ncbi:MAG: GNAT family N-acetyltransferase [Clostridiales bacterium]|nr:GNAT family N-acetyltransferase [Clostridiales bacterium]
MVYELADTSKAALLFGGWQETLITSCLQKVMGRVYVTDLERPRSAFAFVGCFGFFAGEPDRELVRYRPAGFMILTPQNDEWAKLIQEVYPSAKKVTRYAIKKAARFDREKLKSLADSLPEGYELRKIDTDIYDSCLKDPLTCDFVSCFESKESFLKLGRGMVVLKDGKIVSGASSYTRYNEGIEIEVDTVPLERRKGLATASCAALILSCIEEGLYPSWDAQNLTSVHMAEKLGYEFSHEYTVYEVSSNENTD